MRRGAADEACLILSELGLGAVEEVIRDEGRHRDRDPLRSRAEPDPDRLRPGTLTPVEVGAPCVQLAREDASDRTRGKDPGASRTHPEAAELAGDAADRALFLDEPSEEHPHHTSFVVVRDQPPGRSGIWPIAIRHRARHNESAAGLLPLAAHRPLADLLALELGDHALHVQEQAALRSVVGGAGQELDGHARTLEFLQQHQLVPEPATQPIRGVNQEHLKRPAAYSLAQALERGPVETGTRVAVVLKDAAVGNCVALLVRQRAQFGQLAREAVFLGLFVRAHARVEGSPHAAESVVWRPRPASRSSSRARRHRRPSGSGHSTMWITGIMAGPLLARRDSRSRRALTPPASALSGVGQSLAPAVPRPSTGRRDGNLRSRGRAGELDSPRRNWRRARAAHPDSVPGRLGGPPEPRSGAGRPAPPGRGARRAGGSRPYLRNRGRCMARLCRRSAYPPPMKQFP